MGVIRMSTNEENVNEIKTRKIDIELEDIRVILSFGKIILEDQGIELILRRKADNEILFREIKPFGHSAKIILPKKWLEKYEKVVAIPFLGTTQQQKS